MFKYTSIYSFQFQTVTSGGTILQKNKNQLVSIDRSTVYSCPKFILARVSRLRNSLQNYDVNIYLSFKIFPNEHISLYVKKYFLSIIFLTLGLGDRLNQPAKNQLKPLAGQDFQPTMIFKPALLAGHQALFNFNLFEYNLKISSLKLKV